MAKRRANGEGSLRKRKDGRWEGRYTAGTDPVTGKAIIKNVLGKTQAEVKEKLKKAIAESGELDIKRSGMYTVGEWMDLWYEVYAKPRIRESTAVYYKMFIDTHIRPKLGDIKLNQLQTMDIQRLYNELRENGRIRKEIKDKQPGLSVSYIRGMHNMLKACLNSAVEERLILRNPAEGCKLPKAEKKEMKVLTQEQLGSYLAAADKRGLLPMFFLELTTGLRKGELVPLLWSDVDEKNIKCPPDTFCTSLRTGAGLSNPIQRIKRTPSERMGFFLWQNYYKLIQCTVLWGNAPKDGKQPTLLTECRRPFMDSPPS